VPAAAPAAPAATGPRQRWRRRRSGLELRRLRPQHRHPRQSNPNHLRRLDRSGSQPPVPQHRRWPNLATGSRTALGPDAIHAGFDTQGIMYVDYGNSPGPGGTTVGAVWKFNPRTALGPTSPGERRRPHPRGYGGLGIDRQHPGTLVVASLNRKDTKPAAKTTTASIAPRTAARPGGHQPKSHRDSSAAPMCPGRACMTQ